MAAFQKAAEEPSAKNTKKPLSYPTKKKFGGSSFRPTTSSSARPSFSKTQPAVGKLKMTNQKSFTPTVVSSSSSSSSTINKPAVGKLDKDKANVIAAVLNPGVSGGGSSCGGVIATIRSAPFDKSSLTAGAMMSQEEQTQATMSEKARNSSVAPPELNPTTEEWEYFYQLSTQYEQLKAQGVEITKDPNAMPQSAARQKAPTKRHEAGDTKNIKSSLEGLLGGTPSLTASGNFLTKEYLDDYLVQDAKFGSLTFDYAGQTKLFKRFDRKDSEQRSIAQKFVQVLLEHPRATEITNLNLSNAMLPDVFLEELAKQCLAAAESGGGLPKLRVLNLESNLLAQNGTVALSHCLKSSVFKQLQVLKLENQKMPLPSEAEAALGEALLVCRSLVVVSLRIRDGLARQQVNNSVAFNIDLLRQARRQHGAQTGTLTQRKRNEMEQYFDAIAGNTDESITAVDLTGNLKFLGLNATERVKTATAFATNTTVQTLKMVKLKLDDAFAKELGKALALNTTLEKVCLDSNDISGAGIIALLQGLAQNTSIVDLQVRHQSKTMASADEQGLPDLLQDNRTVLKVGVDVRNPLVRTQLERKTNANREWQRRQRRQKKVEAN